MKSDYYLFCEDCDISMVLEADGDLEDMPKFCPFCAGDIDLLDGDEED